MFLSLEQGGGISILSTRHARIDLIIGEVLLIVISCCRTMLVEGSHHRAVALPERMHMPHRDAEHDSVIQHISDIQIGIPLRNDEDVVALVVVALAIFDDDMIIGIDIDVKRIETAVASHLDSALAMECAVIGIVFLLKIKMHLDIRLVDVRTLHILEELGVYREILLVMSILQLGELNLIS